MPETASRSSALLRRLVALVVLLVAAYVLFKVVLNLLSGVFFLVLVVGALLAVAWAYSTLKRR